MKMRKRRRAYCREVRYSKSVIWSRWKRQILSRLPADVIQSLHAKGLDGWWIAGWATQPCLWVKGWPSPVTMRNPETIRFAAACLRAAGDDRGEPAIPAAVAEWNDI